MGERERNGGILAKLGNGGPLTERLDSMANEARHRLDAIERHLARISAQSTRTELRGELFSRTATSPAPGGGGLAEVTLAPSAGTIWELALIMASVPDCPADRQAIVYLGDAGDRTRPVARITCASTAEGVGGTSSLGQIGPMVIARPLYVRFLALAAGETAVLHIVGRELTAEGEIPGAD